MNDIAQIINFLIDAYPRQEIQPGTVKVYQETLKDIDPALLKAAVLKHISKSPWFPSVSELRDSAASLIEQANGEPDAYTAWNEVVEQIRKIGSWGDPEFSNSRITKTVQGIGGWRSLCMSEYTIADRARFVEAYNTYQARDQEDRRMLPAVHNTIAELAASKRLSIGAGNGS